MSARSDFDDLVKNLETSHRGIENSGQAILKHFFRKSDTSTLTIFYQQARKAAAKFRTCALVLNDTPGGSDAIRRVLSRNGYEMAYHVLNHFNNGRNKLLEDLEQEAQWDEAIIPTSLIDPQPATTARAIVLREAQTTAQRERSAHGITSEFQDELPEQLKLDEDGRIPTKYKGKSKERGGLPLKEVTPNPDVQIDTPTVTPTRAPEDPSHSKNPAHGDGPVVLVTKRKRAPSQKSKALIDSDDEESLDASPKPEARKKARVGTADVGGNKARKGLMEERPPPQPVVGQYWIDVEEIVEGGSCKMCTLKGWTCKVSYTKPSEQPEVKRDPTDIRERPYKRQSCHQCHSHKVSCNWSDSRFEPSVAPEGVYNNAPAASDEEEQARAAKDLFSSRTSGQAPKRGPGRPRKKPVSVQAPLPEAPQSTIEMAGGSSTTSPADAHVAVESQVSEAHRFDSATSVGAPALDVHAAEKQLRKMLQDLEELKSKQEALSASAVEKVSLSALLNSLNIDIDMNAPTGLGRIISQELAKYVTKQSLRDQQERQSVDMKNHVTSSIERNNDWIRDQFKEVNHGLEQWKTLQPYFAGMEAMDAVHRKESPTLWAALKNLKRHGIALEGRLSMTEDKFKVQNELLQVMDFNIKQIPKEFTHKTIGDETVVKLTQNYRMVDELRDMLNEQTSHLTNFEDANDSRQHNTEYRLEKLHHRVTATEQENRKTRQTLLMHDHVLSHVASSPLLTNLPTDAPLQNISLHTHPSLFYMQPDPPNVAGPSTNVFWEKTEDERKNEDFPVVNKVEAEQSDMDVVKPETADFSALFVDYTQSLGLPEPPV